MALRVDSVSGGVGTEWCWVPVSCGELGHDGLLALRQGRGDVV